jgi:hypothetical protein
MIAREESRIALGAGISPGTVCNALFAARGENGERQRERDESLESGDQAPRIAGLDPAKQAAPHGGPQQPAPEHKPKRNLSAAREHQQLAHQHDLRGHRGEADQSED